ncbi:hypothetical protein FOXG_12447 [Fusarium oxysporum f. sp. lycopersici 4287]|uniref:Uncharacterized protein n=3 Tax=Fusarium oxysporum TaxID=5507 RepID=A0A0J9VS95_FUSO4|nr:hypothetical protein FOXG_12447 [Fusarium oxysporum f. sp. lycopersici 4287]EWZ77681.1 hypothetical protein FOWG_17930 [Fusarium oxysporum f. sp. lycopersici MN25]KNB13718.1 hypothetical protein FOXG_12447 [Fusarium oxysporum f. sp. lycopersici 4287]
MVISTPQPLWIRTRMHLVISPSVPYTFYKGGCPVSQLSHFGPFTFLICFELGFFALPQKVSERAFYYIMVSTGGKAPWTIPTVDSAQACFIYEIRNIKVFLWQQLVTIADGLSNKETAREEVLGLLRNSAGVEDQGFLSLLSTVDMQDAIRSVKFDKERQTSSTSAEILEHYNTGNMST